MTYDLPDDYGLVAAEAAHPNAPFPNPYVRNSTAWHTFERHWANQTRETAEAQRDAVTADRVREDEIVAEWYLDRDHHSEGEAIRRLAKAIVLRERERECRGCINARAMTGVECRWHGPTAARSADASRARA